MPVQIIYEKGNYHKMGTNVGEEGVLPDMEIFQGFNPARLLGIYLRFVPDGGTLEGKPARLVF